MKYNFEILIKSFIRFEKLLRLLYSIQKYYPHITIRVADDSPNNKEREEVCHKIRSMKNCHFYHLPFNVGLCVGRNFLLKKVKTPYFVLLDDDFVFMEDTSLEKLEKVMRGDQNCLIAGGRCLRDKQGFHRHGHAEIRGNEIILYIYGSNAPKVQINGVECVPCRMTPNFFMGNIALFRKHHIRWDERLKLREHVWFFINLPKQLKIYYVPDVRIDHHLDSKQEKNIYNLFRLNKNELTKMERLTGLKIHPKLFILHEDLFVIYRNLFMRLLRKIRKLIPL